MNVYAGFLAATSSDQKKLLLLTTSRYTKNPSVLHTLTANRNINPNPTNPMESRITYPNLTITLLPC